MISLKHFGAGLHITTHCGTDWIVCMCWEFSAQRADAKQLERFLHDHSKLSLPLSSTCSQLFLSLSLLLKSKLKCVNNCFWVNVRLVFWSVCVCVCLFGSSQPAPGNVAWYGRSPLWCHFPFLSGYSQHSTARSRELWELRAGSLAPSQEWKREGRGYK